MTDPALRALLDREAIRDVLLRYCRAVDRRDLELLRSVYHADAIHEFGALRGPAHELAARIVEELGRYDVTTHALTNTTIALRGDRARAESYVTAVHRASGDAGEREWVLQLRYLDRLARRDGAWRISHRTTLLEWSREAAATGALSPLAASLPRGRRDRDDPSYGEP